MFYLSKLKPDYQALFDSCHIRLEWRDRVDQVIKKITANKVRYQQVAGSLGWEDHWYFLGGIHNLESGCDFSRHLHNGDPLTNQTVRVPAGRPTFPPAQGWDRGYSWEESALDALTLKDFKDIQDISIAAWLWRGELYNGFGYRALNVLSPYLWSGTNHYHQGKYIADGVYDKNAISQQVGLACVLKAFTETKVASSKGLLKVIGDRTAGFTWAKTSTQQNYTLSDQEKTRVSVDSTFEFTLLAHHQGHYSVQLACQLQSEDKRHTSDTWYFFEDHVELMMERSQAELTLAEKVVQVCQDKGYPLDQRLGAINIIGLEGVNPDGSFNSDTPDQYNDVVGVLRIDKTTPYFECLFKATTEPGKYYTITKLLNPLGCARLQLGYHPHLWVIGKHRNYTALVQHDSPVKLVRDRNRNFMRDDSETVEYWNGINLHHGDNSATIGRHSAGCVVIQNKQEFQAFLSVCRRSLQHQEGSKFSFILLWKDWL